MARGTKTLPSRLELLSDSTSLSERCPKLVRDPADRATMPLVRSLPNGRADYEINGRYQAKPNELIRIHCRDGSVAGLVPR